MKIAASLLVASATLASLAGASYHNHRHMHHHAKKRDIQTVTVDGPVEVAYVFEGQVIPESAVCQGLANGTFEWAQGTENQPNCDGASNPPPAPPPSSPSTPAAPSSSDSNQFLQDASPSSAPPTSSPSPSPQSNVNVGGGSSSSGSSGSSSSSNLSGYYAEIATNANVDKSFPDGEVDCTDFPSDFGAVPVSYLNLGGYTGIQETTINNGMPGNINTATSGGTCSGGNYCSYACPAGYMKTQFPDQNSGTSVGGLLCGSDGKLHKTNTGFDTLCTQGAGSAGVQNDLDDVVCVCGTDYPGELAPELALTGNMLIRIKVLKRRPCLSVFSPAIRAPLPLLMALPTTSTKAPPRQLSTMSTRRVSQFKTPVNGEPTRLLKALRQEIGLRWSLALGKTRMGQPSSLFSRPNKTTQRRLCHWASTLRLLVILVVRPAPTICRQVELASFARKMAVRLKGSMSMALVPCLDAL